ncbi:MAG: diguanylate cyclase [Candidatus Gygaella obscura]|nr:diguanylate cyclase [Candidatus Gygaella obscura]
MLNQNIVFIESNEFTRKMVESDLLKAGYNVVGVSSYNEALDRIKDQPFGVIIAEIKVKEFGKAVEVIRKFKQKNSESRIIVATNYDSIMQAAAALNEGAHDYIMKPFNLHELRMVIENTLEMQNVDDELKDKHLDVFKDEVTKIYNHTYFEEALKIEINRSQRYPSEFIILLVDIDNFKFITNSYGKEIANNILKMLGELVYAGARKSDCVCRFGPDEFSVILPETKKDGAFIMGTRLLSLIRQENFIGLKHKGELTVSIGMAAFPEDGKSYEEILATATNALKEAKNLGKNRIVFF